MCLYTQYIFRCSHEATKLFKTTPCAHHPTELHIQETRSIILKRSCHKCRMTRLANRRTAKEADDKSGGERVPQRQKLKVELERASAELSQSQGGRSRQIKAENEGISKDKISTGTSTTAQDRAQSIRRGAISDAGSIPPLETTSRHEYNAQELVWYPELTKFKNIGFQNLNPWRKASLRRSTRIVKPKYDELLSPKSLPKGDR